MYLTDEEKRMLAGAQGEAVALAMRILTRIGDIYGAERLAPIRFAHSGSQDAEEGRGTAELLQKYADLGGKFRTVTTVNPIGCTAQFERWPEFPEPDPVKESDNRRIDLFKRLGAIPNWSCTPYFQGNLPRFGECIASAESSACCFYNSVIGARTNRTAVGTDITAAIAARVARFGLLLDENRAGNALVRMEFQPRTVFDYNNVGFVIGTQLSGKIPVIEGLPPSTDTNDLKYLGASAATRGGIALYHAVGITPEARTREDAFKGKKPEAEIVIKESDIKATIEELSTNKSDGVDAIVVGCPHLAMSEVREIADLLQGKKVRRGVEFLIFISRDALIASRQMGYIETIEAAGGKIFEGTCYGHHPFRDWGIQSIATNSSKCAQGRTCVYTDIKGCVELATR